MDTEKCVRQFYCYIDRINPRLVLSRKPGLSPRVKMALEFIEENYRQPDCWCRAARCVRMHRSSLSRKIRKELVEHDIYLTPHEYTNGLRVREARKLLLSDPLLLEKEIAVKVGMNPTGFRRVFREFTGRSPISFRGLYSEE